MGRRALRPYLGMDLAVGYHRSGDKRLRADSLMEGVESSERELLDQARDDGLNNSGTLVNQAGIELEERSACADFLPGVRGGENAADANNDEASARLAVDVADDFGAAGLKRFSAETAGFGVKRGESWRRMERARDGSIRRDDAGKAALESELDDFVDGIEGKVRGNFDEERFGCGV